MICKKCGQMIEDNVTFCPACGNKVETTEQILHEGSKQSKPKKHLMLVVVLVSVAVLIAILTNVIGIHSSATKIAETLIESQLELDFDKEVKCYPDFILREMADEYELDLDATKSEIAEARKKDYRYASRTDVETITAKIIKTYDDPNDCDVYWRGYRHMFSDEFDEIKEVALVTVFFTVDEDEYTRELSVDVYCVKIKNKWYYLCDD